MQDSLFELCVVILSLTVLLSPCDRMATCDRIAAATTAATRLKAVRAEPGALGAIPKGASFLCASIYFYQRLILTARVNGIRTSRRGVLHAVVLTPRALCASARG